MDVHLLYESDVAAVSRKIVRFGDASYQVSTICSVAVTQRPRLHAVANVLGRDDETTLWAAGGRS